MIFHTYSKKWLKVAAAFALVTAPALSTIPVFQPEQVSAAVKDTTGYIEVLVQDDAKVNPANVADVFVSVISKNNPKDARQPIAENIGDNAKTGTDGKFKTPKLEAGTYYVTIQKGNVSQTSVVKVTGGGRTVSAKFIYENGTAPDVKKTGVVMGIVYNSATSDTVLTSTTDVTLVSKKVKYTVPTKNGVFKVFVPAGTYDFIVKGQDTAGQNDKRNINYGKIKVSAGQGASILQQLSGSEDWATTDANKLGFTIPRPSPTTISNLNEAKSYIGTAIANGIVSVYDRTTSDAATVDTAKLLAEATIKPIDKKDLTKGGKYTLKLKTGQPGRTLLFKVEDTAGNVYFEEKTLDKYDPKLTAAAADKAPLGGNVALSFTDATKAFASSITRVTVIPTTGDTTPINVSKYDKTTKKGYLVSGTKLIITGENFKNVGDYKIEVKALGFIDQSITQPISVAKANAPALIAAASPGTTEDTTKVTVTATTADTTFFVQVKNLTVPIPKLGASLPPGSGEEGKTFITNYKSGDNIPFNLGSKATAKGYIALYEVNSLNQVVAFSFLTVTQSQVKNDIK